MHGNQPAQSLAGRDIDTIAPCLPLILGLLIHTSANGTIRFGRRFQIGCGHVLHRAT